MLTSQRTVFSFMWLVDKLATFTDGEDEGDPRFFFLTAEAWEDMGEPTTITVTVQPGDLLND